MTVKDHIKSIIVGGIIVGLVVSVFQPYKPIAYVVGFLIASWIIGNVATIIWDM